MEYKIHGREYDVNEGRVHNLKFVNYFNNKINKGGLGLSPNPFFVLYGELRKKF